jgi:hypothetical protein
MNYNQDNIRLRDAIISGRNASDRNQNSGKVQKIGQDRIYYNVIIPHNDAVSINGSPTVATFSEVRSDSLFDGEPKDYSMSVVRFTIPTQYIPLLIFPVIPNPGNPSDPNYGLQSVTLSYNNIDFKTNLIFIPQNQFAQVPSPPTLGSNPQRYEYVEYYSIYSVQWQVDLINTALQTSFNNLKSTFPGVSPTAPPFLSYTTATGLVTLYAQPGYSTDQSPPYVQIFFSNYLYELFETSFEVINYGWPTTFGNQGKNIQFIIKDKKTNNVTLPAPQGAVYAMTQDYDTIPNWLPFSSIVFTSGSLPIRYEWISGGNTQQQIEGTTGISSENFRRIVTDFESDTLTGFENRSFIHYVPTAEYRRIDLLGNVPIKTIDIQVWWKDNYDNLYPILIPAHSEVSIKILFERKR